MGVRGQTAPPTKTSKVNNTMRVGTYGSIYAFPKRFNVVFKNNTATCFADITILLGQPDGLSTETCLYAGADRLSSSLNQRMARGQLINEFGLKFTRGTEDTYNPGHHVNIVSYLTVSVQSKRRIISESSTNN